MRFEPEGNLCVITSAPRQLLPGHVPETLRWPSSAPPEDGAAQRPPRPAPAAIFRGETPVRLQRACTLLGRRFPAGLQRGQLVGGRPGVSRRALSVRNAADRRCLNPDWLARRLEKRNARARFRLRKESWRGKCQHDEGCKAQPSEFQLKITFSEVKDSILREHNCDLLIGASSKPSEAKIPRS